MECVECKSKETTKAGFTWKKRAKVQRWRCKGCGLIFTEPENLTGGQVGRGK